MSPKQLDEEAIFDFARRIESEEMRAEYLLQACGADAALLARVNALLEVHDQRADFLESPPSGVDVTVDQSMTERPGATIGNYKLIEQIGEGGMGVVYVAEQERPMRRRVALKVIKPGMDSKEVISRFAAERQALAMMDHPNIAQVYDAGATDTGRPYFVMELVRGIAITEYCDLNQFNARERLELFVDVCHAIQHAHQKGIIHRDLKPSNVLITEHDGTPVVKVIDFGVAKAINQQLTERTIYTRHQQMVGTPMYMSPEQAELSALDVDTRSDIYSLGVLLYEMLTGTTPFDKARLSEAAYDEIRRIIREEEPSKPSTKIRTLGKMATSVTGYRRTDAKRLSQLLRGDLDWIVMKSLEKDRNRRYDTAKGLASDIQRHLNDEAIVARPPSTAYQFRKFARRHKALLTSAGSITLALVVGTGIATWKAIEANNSRQLAENAEQQQKSLTEFAQQQAAEAEALARSEAAARDRADQAQRLATAEAQRNQRLSYLSDVNLAHQIYLSGDLARATRLLMRHLPNDEHDDLRGFEWHFLWNICHGPSVRALPREGMVEVAYSPDGRTFATGGSDGMIRIWDRDTRIQKAELPLDPDPHAQYRRIDVLYSPKGKLLAGLFRRRAEHASGRVVIFDINAGSSWYLAHPSPNNVVQFAFERDGNTLITAERNGEVRFWDALTGQPLRKRTQLETAETWRRATFSSDLRLLAAGGPKRPGALQPRSVQIKIYNLETDSVESQLETEGSILGKLQFTEDGRFLLNPGNPPYANGKLVVWEVATGKEVISETEIRCYSGAARVSSDEIAVGGPGSISFVSPVKGGIVNRWDGVPGIVTDLALSPDGKQLASSSWDGIVRLWDLPRKENPLTVALDIPATENLCFSPSGDMLASQHPGGVVLRNTVDFKPVYHLDAQTRPVFSPADDCLVTMSARAARIHFWDYRSKQQTSHPVSLEGYEIEQLEFSADGKFIGCATADGAVIILDVATHRIHKQLDFPSKGISRYLAFGVSGDGQDVIAIPAGERTVKLVNLVDGAEQIREVPMGTIRDVAFSPDGKRLVSWGNDIFVLNTNSGEIELSIEESSFVPMQVVFSPDGSSLLSREWGGSLVLWDLQSGREKMRLLENFKQQLQSVAFSPDGNRIVAGVDNSALLVWSAPQAD